MEEAADICGVDVTAAQEIHDPPKPSKKAASAAVAAETAAITSAIERENADHSAYQLPPVSFLRAGKRDQTDATEEIRFNRDRLDTALSSFGVNATIRDVTRGPTVTRYDLELEAGVKLNKITNLSGDLALALGVENVRIAPIPDKISTVGIEVPNQDRQRGLPARHYRLARIPQCQVQALVCRRQGHRRQLHHRQHLQAAAYAHRRHDRLR